MQFNGKENKMESLFTSDDLFAGRYKELSSKDNGVDGYFETIKADIVIRVINSPDEIDISQVKDAIREEYNRGCRCEHDCCGHLFGGIIGDVVYKSSLYFFKVSYNRNV
jgi:hypothetical protein